MDAVIAEVMRGERVESAHLGAAIVVDADGAEVFTVGDVDAPVYPRSAVKALQTLPMVESGVPDRLGLTEAEIALTCASHSGEPRHVETARSILAKAGRDETCLECGVQWPIDAATTRALAAAGETPSAIHNNCSGKHSGFICLACDRGVDPAGYIKAQHPAMREVTAALSEMTGTRLDDSNRATDGCSIPTYAIPLEALALAFARFGSGAGLAPARAAAAARVRAAVTADPFLVSGTGRFDNRLMTALGTRVFSKGGAEGVHCAAIPELGLGIAIKARDGAGRAAEVAMAALVARLLPDAAGNAELTALREPVLKNWNGIHVGAMRAAPMLRA
ncbi:MAG TPA: asparaginase [Acetobacteraceae bacterium]|nr:asparaginase [Acetobacteraceae bacterium]